MTLMQSLLQFIEENYGIPCGQKTAVRIRGR